MPSGFPPRNSACPPWLVSFARFPKVGYSRWHVQRPNPKGSRGRNGAIRKPMTSSLPKPPARPIPRLPRPELPVDTVDLAPYLIVNPPFHTLPQLSLSAPH